MDIRDLLNNEPQVGDLVEMELGDVLVETIIDEVLEDGVVIRVNEEVMEQLVSYQRQLKESTDRARREIAERESTSTIVESTSGEKITVDQVIRAFPQQVKSLAENREISPEQNGAIFNELLRTDAVSYDDMYQNKAAVVDRIVGEWLTEHSVAELGGYLTESEKSLTDLQIDLWELFKHVTGYRPRAGVVDWTDEQWEDPQFLKAQIERLHSGQSPMSEDVSGSGNPVEQAIIGRILSQRTDLLQKFGVQAVQDAVEEVAGYVGDTEEIGSSDVSGWIRQVERMLGGVMEQHDPWKEKYFGPNTKALKKIFLVRTDDKAYNVKAETEQQAREIIAKHAPDSEIVSIKFVKNLMAEAGSPAQQAAIAVNMKKAGKTPKSVDEGAEPHDYKVGEQADYVPLNGGYPPFRVEITDIDGEYIEFRSVNGKPIPGTRETEWSADPGWRVLTPVQGMNEQDVTKQINEIDAVQLQHLQKFSQQVSQMNPAELEAVNQYIMSVGLGGLGAVAGAIGGFSFADMFMSVMRRTMSMAKKKTEVDAEEVIKLQRQIVSIHKRLKTLKSEPAIAKYQNMLKQAYEVLAELEARQGNKVAEGKTGPGLWANIHAKRERIKKGSGERMRKPGSEGAPKAADFKAAQAKNESSNYGDLDEESQYSEGTIGDAATAAKKQEEERRKYEYYITYVKPRFDSRLDALGEAKYQGREVPLNSPMAGDVKKSKVYVKNAKGNVVKVNFGDKNMRIKKSNPKRRKSFRARHGCDNPGPKWKAKYWSCRAW